MIEFEPRLQFGDVHEVYSRSPAVSDDPFQCLIDIVVIDYGLIGQTVVYPELD